MAAFRIEQVNRFLLERRPTFGIERARARAGVIVVVFGLVIVDSGNDVFTERGGRIRILNVVCDATSDIRLSEIFVL